MEESGIQKFLNSYSVKMVVVAGLALVLLIPSVLIQEIIKERIAQSELVKSELYEQWSSRQVVSGPVLNVPYTVTEPSSDGNNQWVQRQGTAHFLPETFHAEGVLSPGTRKRSIYSVVVYEGKLSFRGSFAPPSVSRPEQENATYNWKAAYFTMGITDMRGIKNLPVLTVNRLPLVAEPGVADKDLFSSGLTFMAASTDPSEPIEFEVDLLLNGSENLMVELLGKTTRLSLKSDWPDPAFRGAYLPDHREVSERGFQAEWNVTHLNRNFPQYWTDNRFTTREAAAGVELLIPVDHYQKSMRSAKYAILFIALNFIVLLFIELKSKTRIHPFQYALVALALLLFYALLTALGEQTGFNVAYILSALLITGLVTWYAASIAGNRRTIAGIALLQTGLYTFLFVILQLEEYALLAGTIGLFVILALIMRASQKIVWYNGGE